MCATATTVELLVTLILPTLSPGMPVFAVRALTANTGIPGDSVGKINVTNNSTVVAVAHMHADKALAVLTRERIKGKSFKARIISDRPWSRGTRTS